jgi:tetratricopeptide (TPR) repeat protein
LYVVFENYYAAADAYDEALQYSPNYIACRMDYGIILSEQLADYDKAIQEYSKIIDSRPFMLYIPSIYNNLKSVKANRGLAYYNMGVAYRSKSIYMGENTYASHQYLSKAENSYDGAKKLMPKDYDTHYNSAITNQLLGHIKEAGLEYCKAIEIRPYNFEAHYNYALLLMSLKFNKEALSELEKAGMLANTDADAEQRKYIYQVLGEVRQNLVNSGDIEFLNNRVDVSEMDNFELAYKDGKVILRDNADELLKKKLITCPKKKYFEDLK